MEKWNKKAEENLSGGNLPRTFVFCGFEKRTSKKGNSFEVVKLDGYISEEKGYSFFIPQFKVDGANVKPEVATGLIGHLVEVRVGSEPESFYLEFQLAK
jgi:hypothetical protein